MGLDMYVNGIRKIENAPSHGIVNYAALEEANIEICELAYWRKFNNLHGWMERLYADKGGTDQFNCQSVQLTMDDLDQLERDVMDDPLKKFRPVSGAFFGSQHALTPDDKSNILGFVGLAKAFLRLNPEGAVYYDSCW